MSNLVKDVAKFDAKVYKISGPLGQNFKLKQSEGKIEIGQVLAYDDTTGELVKYEKGSKHAFTIALSEADSTSEAAVVLVAVPGTVFNKAEIKGAELESDFAVIKELWDNGITLEEVK